MNQFRGLQVCVVYCDVQLVQESRLECRDSATAEPAMHLGRVERMGAGEDHLLRLGLQLGGVRGLRV